MPNAASAEEASVLLDTAFIQGRRTLSEPEAKHLLRVLGIPVPPGLVARNATEATDAAASIGFPVVVKAVASDLSHKTEAGGVVCPVRSPEELVSACDQIAQNIRRFGRHTALEAYLVEAYRPGNPEWILGARVDPLFGPSIMFGLGGIYVDILRQISFRLAPLTAEDVEVLLSETPAARILEGVRGRSPADRESLKSAIRRLSEFIANPTIAARILEIEINPLTINEHGILALDALVVLRPQGDRS